MTINFFDTSFYDKESSRYSSKRYATAPISYVQFFFRERLRHVVGLVGRYVGNRKDQVLIEDGCADGIVAETVYKKYPHVFSSVVGTDISPEMIKAAKEMNTHPALSFFLKSELPGNVAADIVLAVGFLSVSIFEDEFSFIRKHLKKDGLVILSLVGKDSIHARLKSEGRKVFADYRSYNEYEKILRSNFVVVSSRPYGIFIPKLWSVPGFARVLQPLFEFVFRPFPHLYHEKLYVLRLK